MEKLPIEIINVIAHSLNQFDLVSLSGTNKSLHQILIPKLYKSITVDSSKTHLQHDLSSRTTTIKSLHSLKLFLNKLIKNPEYGGFIRHLALNNEIPDMSEIMLNKYLEIIFPILKNLNTLNWFIVDPYLSFELLKLLPLEKLCTLGGNFKNFEVVETLIRQPLKELEKLEISGFNTASNLSKIDMLKFPNLHDLTILKNSCGKSKSVTNLIEIDTIDENYLSCIFAHAQNLNLSSLTLKDICITSVNANDLIRAINIPHLKKLSIINCTEVMFENDSFIRRSPPPVLFLDLLGTHLSTLESLVLNFLNDLADNNSILRLLNLIYLNKLDILITCKNGESLNEDLAAIISSLVNHPLKELKLDFIIPNTNYKKITVPITTLSNLSKLDQLQILKAPVERRHFESLFPMISELSKLIVLHLIVNTQKIPTNSLIDQNYFDFAIPGLSHLQENLFAQFYDYCKDFKFCNQNLEYLIFETPKILMFECRNRIELVDM